MKSYKFQSVLFATMTVSCCTTSVTIYMYVHAMSCDLLKVSCDLLEGIIVRSCDLLEGIIVCTSVHIADEKETCTVFSMKFMLLQMSPTIKDYEIQLEYKQPL